MAQKAKKKSKLRHAEYYDMQKTFDSLYADSKSGEVFGHLMDIISAPSNIKLAFRNIKGNDGSHTAGTDGRTIESLAVMPEDKFVKLIQKQFRRYEPKAVKRVEIPKPNGKMRPLGIPCIIDRIVQQCILQVMEPICEAKFYEHSYGFRPCRSAENAISYAYGLAQRNKLHYVIDVDVKGFFDNVDHRKLLKQIWTLGIRDTKLIQIIKAMLKAPIEMPDTEVGEIATQVGTTPAGWNAGIFNMIRSLSENVIVPIAGVIITFVMCYELIQLVIEKNNLHDLDTWIFFKWIFKTFVAVLLVTNTWNIVMGVFDITQSVVNDSAGVIISDTSIDIATVITDIEAKLDAMSVGGLLGLWFQSLFVGLTMKALSICIMLVVYGRMIEIYLVTSIAPIPVATMVNREWGGMGQNYLKSLLALGFQAFLILVCVGIYAVLIQTIAATDDISGAIWSCMGYTVLLCFTLFKTGSLAKSVFSAH